MIDIRFILCAYGILSPLPIFSIYLDTEGVDNDTMSSHHDADFREKFIRVYAKYCGVDNLCHPEKTNATVDYMLQVYCGKCYCKKECVLYGNCCPDYAQTNPITALAPAFTCTKISSGRVAHYMVSNCKNTSVDNAKINRCLKPLNGTIANMPVTSLETNVTYTNVFCAKCNGDIDISTWNLNLNCRITVTAENWFDFNDKIKLTSLQCEFVYSPKEITIYVPMCEPDLINACNVSGNWQKYNEFLERACKYFISPVDIYSNIFCALCNEDEPAVIDNDFPIDMDSDVTYLFTFMPEETLIRGDDPQYDTECSNGTIYDETTGVCINIYCAKDKVFRNMTCDSIFINARGLMYEVKFVLTSTREIVLNERDVNNFIYRLITEYFEIVNVSTSYLLKFESIAEISSTVMHNGGVIISGAVVTIKLHCLEDADQHDLETRLFKFGTSRRSFVSRDVIHEFQANIAGDVQIPTGTERSLVTNYVLMLTGHMSEYLHIVHQPAFIAVDRYLLCPFIRLRKDQVEILSGDIQLRSTGNTIVDAVKENNTFYLVCFQEYIKAAKMKTENELSIKGLLSFACVLMSMVCLALTVFTFAMFPSLRSIPGKSTLCLSISLLLAQGMFQFGFNRTGNSLVCKAIGVLIHYFWLSVLFWMNVCSFHMFRTFSNLLAKSYFDNSRKILLSYMLYANGLPIIIIIITVLANIFTTNHITIGYGGTVCYLSSALNIGLAFSMPVGIILFANLAFLMKTIMSIRSVREMDEISNKGDKRHIGVYLKLSTLTGAMWLVFYIAKFSRIETLDYIAIILNGLQGVFIFVSYVCNRRVWSLYTSCISQQPVGLLTSDLRVSSTRNTHMKSLERNISQDTRDKKNLMPPLSRLD